MRVGERLGFAAAGFGLSLVYFWVALYLLAYLYDGTGLSTRGIATLTMILALGKGWEAIADLLIGLLIDRTRTRWGTFRIYPLITALPLGLLTVLLFTAPGGTETRKLAVIGILYVPRSGATDHGHHARRRLAERHHHPGYQHAGGDDSLPLVRRPGAGARRHAAAQSRSSGCAHRRPRVRRHRLMTVTASSSPAKSLPFRVSRVRSWRAAIAAIWRSIRRGRGLRPLA